MSELLKRLRNQILYGGLSRSGYNEIRPRLNEENYYMLVRASGAATVLGGVMILLTMLGFVRDYAQIAYVVLTWCSAAIFLFAVTYVASHRDLAVPALMLETAVLLVYALLIGTVKTDSPNSYAVSYSAFIVLVPLLLVVPPLPVILLITAANFLVAAITPFYKTPQATGMDIMNAVTFSIIACLVQFLYSNRNMRRIASEQFISMDHDVDGTTHLQNEAALRSMINTYLGRRLDGEEAALILIQVNHPEAEMPEEQKERQIRTAKVLRMMTSRYELIGRIGSETFAVLYRECSKADMDRHYTALREALAEEFGEDGFVISAAGTQASDTFETLYRRASEQL